MTAQNKLVEIERDQLHRWADQINDQEISQLAQQIFEERESAPWRALLEDMRLLERVVSRETTGLATAVNRLKTAISIAHTLENGSRNVAIENIPFGKR